MTFFWGNKFINDCRVVVETNQKMRTYLEFF